MSIVRHARARLSLALAAAAALLVPVGSALAQDGGNDPEQIPGVPVHGQFLVTGINDAGSPAVLTLHGVHRVDGGTIVYYSIGLPEGADLDGQPANQALWGALGGNLHKYQQGLEGVGAHCDVAVIDQVGGWMYAPFPDANGRPAGELCSAEPWSEVGEARAAAVAVAPLPDDLEVVDVSIRGTVFPNVPVLEGALEPVAEPDRQGPLVGMGWPSLDAAAISAADGADRIYPVTSGVQDVAGEITETNTTIELSGDVLFAIDSADINAAGQEVLARAVEQLNDKGVTGTLLVVGHTDNVGSAQMNQELSVARAESVAEFLRTRLADNLTIETDGRGFDEPIASNDTDAGKALNRRVTLDFTTGNE